MPYDFTCEESNEQNKLMDKIEPQAWKQNRLKVTRGRGRRTMVGRREGTRRRTCMNDPQSWTTVWELIVVGVGGMGRGGQRGKNWNNCDRVTIKNI